MFSNMVKFLFPRGQKTVDAMKHSTGLNVIFFCAGWLLHALYEPLTWLTAPATCNL